MSNQLTVSYQEIENRLAICFEFLLDRKKPIKEAYDSLMEKLGTKLMKYSEFEYWFKRFQNNQFDLGYDTSLDEKENSEIQNRKDPKASEENKKPKKLVERKTQNLKLGHQFNEKNVPRIFRFLITKPLKELKNIGVCFNEQRCTINFDESRILLRKKGNNWMICYTSNGTAIKTDDPEKSIIEHLWFVLGNPKIKLDHFGIQDNRNPKSKLNPSKKLDSEKLMTLLQSMFSSLNHQIQTTIFSCEGFNEDTLLSILKHVKPGTLGGIVFNISWKKEDNYQKMKEIIETDQWKQAKVISSSGVSPLKIDNLFHLGTFRLEVKKIIPKDVLRVTEHVFNSPNKKCCILSSNNKNLDTNAILNILRSQNDGSKIIEIGPSDGYKFCYVIMKLTGIVFLCGTENQITIQKH